MFEHHETEDNLDSKSASSPSTGDEAATDGSGDRQGTSHRPAEVLELIAGVERQLEQMKNAQSACADEIASLEDRKKAIASREGELASLASELDASRADLENRSSDVERREQGVSEALAEVESKEADCAAREQHVEKRSEELEALAGELDSRSKELDAERASLASEKETINESLDEARSRLQETESSLTKVQEESLELSSKLEEAAGVIESGEEALAEARAETESVRKSHEGLSDELENKDRELKELQESFDVATERLHALADAVAEQAPKLEEGATAAALCLQQEEQIKGLAADLDEARNKIDSLESIGDGDEALATARNELERLKGEFADSIPIDEHERVVSSLQAKLTGLKSSDSIRSDADMDEVSSAKLPDDAVRLKEQAERLSAFALHLQRRRGRLRYMRDAIRSDRDSDDLSESTSTLENQKGSAREDLLRRRHELTDLESKMVRRWARHGAVAIVARGVLLLALIGALSWFAVRWFSPGSVSATALVRAHPVSGSMIDDARAASWNEWHGSILKDAIFANAVAARLAASPAGFSEGGEALHASFGTNLEVEQVQPGMLQLRLHGDNRSETIRRLEGIVATLSAESQRQLSRRGDGARVEVLPRDGELVTLDTIPISSRQVQNAGIVFGSTALGIGLFGAAIYSRLSRSRRIFDENVGFEEEDLD